MIIADFETEKNLRNRGYEAIIGLDEAGRGPLIGPVVAAAAVWRGGDFPERSDQGPARLWRDSKSLSDKQRQQAFASLRRHFLVAVGVCDHRTIDRINISEASFLAMKKARAELLRLLLKEKPGLTEEKIITLVDGHRLVPNASFAQKAIKRADQKIKTVAVASIVAKVTRDRFLIALAERFPQYALEKNKGYGTAEHLAALRKFGPTPFHRRSFKPVRKILRELGSYGIEV